MFPTVKNEPSDSLMRKLPINVDHFLYESGTIRSRII